MKIYIHADDYAMNMESSERLLRCASQGYLDGLSVFPNGCCLEACEMAGRYGVKLRIHLNLVEGPALSPREEVGLLVDERGYFCHSFAGLLFLLLSRKRKEAQRQMKAELTRQIALVMKITGKDRLGLDSHQHTHMIPGVFRAMEGAAWSAGLQIEELRIPLEPVGPFLRHPFVCLSISPLNVIKNAALRLLYLWQRGDILRLTKGRKQLFMGILFSGNMDERRIGKVLPDMISLARKEGASVELLFHPGKIETGERGLDPEKISFLRFYTSNGRNVDEKTVKSGTFQRTVRRMRTLCAALLAGSLAALSASAEDVLPAVPEKKEYVLDFSDEFEGGSLNTEVWTDQYLPQWCEDPRASTGNYRIEDGCLTLYIDRDQKPWNPRLDGTIVTSAVMSFDKSWIHNFADAKKSGKRKEWYGYVTQYGYFELRAKLSDCGGGGHQAWWMVGMQEDAKDWAGSRQTAEIDIIESFFDMPSRWSYAGFGWNDPDFLPDWYQGHYDYEGDQDLTEEFHVYAMEWTPSSLKFYFDGKLTDVVEGAPDYPMGTILNIYGNTGDSPANNAWPKEWAIDYYRVWKPKQGYSQELTGAFYLKTADGLAYIDPYERETLCGAVPAGMEAYGQWIVQNAGDGYISIQNVGSGEYLHVLNDKGYVEHNVLTSASKAVCWNSRRLEDGSVLLQALEDGQGYVRVLEDGSLGCGAERSDGARWELIPVRKSF